MFCKHRWKVLSEVTTESKLEHSMKIITKACEGDFKLPGSNTSPQRKHIQIITCDKCGKFKRYVENI